MDYTLGVQESIRKIFTAVVVGAINKDNPNIEEKRKVFRYCLPRFLAQFNDNVFQDEYAFIYEMLKTMKIKVFTLSQLREVLERNRDGVLNSPYIDLSKWEFTVDNRPAVDDEKIEAFWAGLREIVVDISNDVVTEEEFSSACEIFINYYIEQSTLETVQNMALILSDTGFLVRKTRGRSTLYKGVQDAERYYSDRQAIIMSLKEEGRLKSVVVDEHWLEDDYKKERIVDEEDLLDTGLTEIDSIIGSFRRSNLVTILGPTKGGKTRFTNYLVNRALNLGLNVCVWPVEGTEDEWISCQVACMIRTEYGASLNSKDILQRRYESDAIRQYVVAAKTRLATDYTRGRLSFIEGSAYVEDFIDTLESHYKNQNAFDIIVIDPLINILSRTGRNKVDRITEGYMKLKDFITYKIDRKALALVPAQLKQDVIDSLRRNPEDTIDITAGGESAETIRGADEIIGLFSSKEERAYNRMKIYSVGSRHSETFQDFVAKCELGCCYFESDPSLYSSI